MEQDYKLLMAFIRYTIDCDIPVDETAVHSFLCSIEHGIVAGYVKVENDAPATKYMQNEEASHGELGDSIPGQ
jgi:hypothetical protein